MEKWNKIIAKVSKKNYDIAVYYLSKISNGFEEIKNENDITLIAYSKETIKGLNDIKEKLNKFNISLETEHYSYDKKIETNWKKYFKTKKISSKFVIKPSWENYSNKDDYHIINLDPGDAFGTGLHGTTKGVIHLLERQEVKNKTVLDCGTGSGILSIAAYKLGAKKIHAFDIDEKATATAIENFNINNVKITAKTEDINNVKGNYDIVLANILSSILLKNKHFIIDKLKKDGILILSGILISEEKKFIKTFMKDTNLTLLEKKHIDEWTSLLFKN